VLQAHEDWINSFATLADGRLASASDDRTIKIWNLATSLMEALLEGHTAGVNALIALPDGRLASASDDRTIRLWDLDKASVGISKLTNTRRVQVPQ
jgi:WD40 repeat protein